MSVANRLIYVAGMVVSLGCMGATDSPRLIDFGSAAIYGMGVFRVFLLAAMKRGMMHSSTV